jgi:hypothetical protein
MRMRTLKLLGVAVVVCMSITGVAFAASSPTVVTGAATKVTNTSAVLNASINPNGSTTDYVFTYGPTTAYGATTVEHSAGAGTKATAVSRTITGLTPGTIYHYRIAALSRFGTTAGADRTFTTTGHPPAAVVTGGTVNIGKTVATPTGTINPEGEATSWAVQYGLTVGYGSETFVGQLAAVDTPVPVSTTLAGLSPGTLFHYRVVAYHGTNITSQGADATFFTEPTTRPKPRLSAHTAPGRDKRSPYTYTTSGTVGGATAIPQAYRCTGNVGVRFYNGRRQLAFEVAPVSPTCTFSTSASFRRLHGPAPAALHVTVDFRGNGYVAAAKRVDHVVAA